MDKTHYLEALKRAMTGLAPEAQAKTLAFYEQRFVDGVAAGRTEADIAAEQDDPTKIAMTLRASSHLAAFEQKKHPANFLRMAFAAVGLAIFNLFMVVPAMVYAALLASLYASGIAFYLAGAVVTASGLSGSDEIKLDGAWSQIFNNDKSDQSKTKVSISEQGINIVTDRDTEDGRKKSTSIVLNDDGVAVDSDSDEEHDDESAGTAKDPIDAVAKKVERAAQRAEADTISLNAGMDDESRATQIFAGIGLILGGILLLLLCLVITRYTLIGAKRYIEMNFSLLKGH